MNSDEQLQVRNPSIRIVLGSAVVAVLGAVSYWAPYIIGRTYCMRRQSMLNIPSGLFEKSSDDYFVYSYYALVTVLSNFSEFLLGDFWRTIYVACISCAFIVYLVFLTWLSNLDSKSLFFSRIKSKRAVQAPLLVLISTSMLTVFVTLGPAMILSILIIPGFIGTQAASIGVEAEKKIYELGCLQPNIRKWQCSRVSRNGAEVAQGFMIESSKDWIALYSRGASTITSVNNTEIEGIAYDAAAK